MQESVFTLRDFAYGLDRNDLLGWQNSRAWTALHDQACHTLDAVAIAKGRLRFAQQQSFPAVAAAVQPQAVANVRSEGRLRDVASMEVVPTSRSGDLVVPSEGARAITLAELSSLQLQSCAATRMWAALGDPG